MLCEKILGRLSLKSMTILKGDLIRAALMRKHPVRVRKMNTRASQFELEDCGRNASEHDSVEWGLLLDEVTQWT